MGTRRAVRSTPIMLLALLACASSGSEVPGDGTANRLNDPDLILREEIDDDLSARSAYELVRNIRPLWLQTRGTATVRQAAGQGDGIRVYLDNARLDEGVEAMRRVALGAVQYMQYFDAREATLRWGGGHLNGAILISTQAR